MHAGQHFLVLGVEGPTPVFHNRTVAAVKDAHGTSVSGHVVKPEPQLTTHSAGPRLEILPCRLDIHVGATGPLLIRIRMRWRCGHAPDRRKAPPKMDAFTASAIAQVYDKVNPANKKKMEDLANGKKSDLMKLQSLAMKFVK